METIDSLFPLGYFRLVRHSALSRLLFVLHADDSVQQYSRLSSIFRAFFRRQLRSGSISILPK